MLNLLLIENNPIELKKLVNTISSNFQEIKLCAISLNKKSSLEILKELNIDIVLLNLNSPDINGIDIIKYLKDQKLYKYQNSIITFSQEPTSSYEIPLNSFIFSHHLIKNGYESLLHNLKMLIIKKCNLSNSLDVKSKIDFELNYLNYNFSYAGTRYLKETILELYKRIDSFDGNLEKNIYPIIAKKYHKKTNTIYCNIKQATKNMLLDCPEEKIISYFNYSYFYQPKINEIIFTILNKL